MKKGWKISLWTIAVLIVVIIVVPVILAVTINPNQFKPEIEKMYHQKTGGTLHIKGDIAWDFIPSLHINVGNLEMLPPKNKPQLPITIDHIDMTVAWWPLLSHTLDLKAFNVQGISVVFQAGKAHGLGRFDVGDLHLNGVVHLPKDMKAKNAAQLLAGHLVFKGSNLRIAGVDLKTTLQKVVNIIQNSHNAGTILPNIQKVLSHIQINEKNGRITELGTLHANTNIIKGVAHFTQLGFVGPIIHMEGAGQVNLATQKPDLALIFTSPLFVGIKTKQMTGLSLPVQIEGDFNKPVYKVNWKPVEQQLTYYFAKALLAQSIESLVDKNKQKKQAQEKKGLAGLFSKIAEALHHK